MTLRLGRAYLLYCNFLAILCAIELSHSFLMWSEPPANSRKKKQSVSSQDTFLTQLTFHSQYLPCEVLECATALTMRPVDYGLTMHLFSPSAWKLPWAKHGDLYIYNFKSSTKHTIDGRGTDRSSNVTDGLFPQDLSLPITVEQGAILASYNLSVKQSTYYSHCQANRVHLWWSTGWNPDSPQLWAFGHTA